MLNKKLLGSVSSPPSDDNFENVSLLLSGDGTNGAQNNTFLDSSTNNFTITRNGNTTQGSFSPYGSNWSNYFNGSSNLVTSSSQVIPSGSYTLEAMVFVTSSSATQTIFAQGTGTGDSARTFLGIEDNSGAKWAIQIGGTQAISSVTPVLNTWHYVAMTFNGSTMTLYLNGTSIASASASTNASNTTLQIGKNWGTYWFNGYISNARVSNTVRTIGAAPTTPFSVDANTVFLSCQANRFFDASSNNYALSIQNGSPSVQRFSPFNPTAPYSTSVIGGSGYFDGSGDSLSAPNNAAFSLGTNDFTVECWVYATTLASGTQILGYSTPTVSSGSDVGVFFQTDSAGVVQGAFYSGTTQYGIIAGTINANTWNHIALVRSSGTLQLYVNGVSVGTTSANVSVNSPAGALFRTGAWTTATWNGYITNVRVVNGTAVYSGSSFAVPTAPLTAVTNTSLLQNFTNAGISDLAMQNNLETVGNAQVSTSVKKYGTGSLAFDGTGDGLVIPSIPQFAFGTGNYTIEFWVNYASVSGDYIFVDMRGSAGGGTAPVIYTTGGVFYVAYATTNIITGTPPAANTWHHIALCRSGSSTKLFVNGTQLGTTYTDSTNLLAYFTTVGYGSNTYYVNGNIDDLRITRGLARYTAAFTPPASALPSF